MSGVSYFGYWAVTKYGAANGAAYSRIRTETHANGFAAYTKTGKFRVSFFVINYFDGVPGYGL